MSYKKDEEEGRTNPYANLEKSAVLQGARKFNEMPVRARQCIVALTKILYIMQKGETLGTREATDTFFSMTKLFQCQDPTLRRMVYLAIKALSTVAEDVMMATSSLMKDMTGNEDSYRAPAIRALCAITDSSMLQSIERFIKQAIVDKSPAVQSAALVSSIHLLKVNADVVKRWVNEVQQAANSRSDMAQYHALGLLYHIKQKDRLAVQKLVATQTRGYSSRSPLACCLLIRYACKVIEADPDSSDTTMYDFIESCLRHKNEMVMYEAARAIVNMKNVSSNQLSLAVSVLQLFLSSPRPTLRFAAVRTLNKVSMSHPNALKTCNLDMEALITDSNRSVATLAITTLLKTGSESSVDRLMKQISSFMHEITDEFKIVVIDAIRALCVKFPQKYPVMMSFLSSALRDEGGFEYKKAIVETMSGIIENVQEAKEYGLTQLCEFIEDCEFPSLLVQVLFLLGEHGPTTPNPNRFIRYIYNRMILESSMVRAAAVNTLAKFAARCEALRPSVTLLLKRALYDGDDEVRDRVMFALDALNTEITLLLDNNPLSLSSMERSLMDYTQNPSEEPFDIKSVPVEVVESKPLVEGMEEAFEAAKPMISKDVERQQTQEAIVAVPQLSHVGNLFKSSDPVNLTESETEYVVRCIKHVFSQHLVFEFRITNTLNDQRLEKVHIVLSGGEQELDESDVVATMVDEIGYDQTQSAYVCIPLDVSSGSQTFECSMEFHVRDCDPDTGDVDEESYEDNYMLEDVEVSVADFVQPVSKPSFAASWEQLEGQFEAEDTFELSTMSNIEEAVGQITKFLGLAPCERSNKVDSSKTAHLLLLSGVFVGGHEVMAQARLVMDEGVNLQLTVRSDDEATGQLIITAVG